MQRYIFSQGHVGEGQWEGRAKRENLLLMHWPFWKEPCSRTRAGHSLNNPIFLWAELQGWTQIFNNSRSLGCCQLRVSCGLGSYENTTGLGIGLFTGFKVCGSDYVAKNSPLGYEIPKNTTVLPIPDEPWTTQQWREWWKERSPKTPQKCILKDWRIKTKQIRF